VARMKGRAHLPLLPAVVRREVAAFVPTRSTALLTSYEKDSLCLVPSSPSPSSVPLPSSPW
jgi:hypothetical protein